MHVARRTVYEESKKVGKSLKLPVEGETGEGKT